MAFYQPFPYILGLRFMPTPTKLAEPPMYAYLQRAWWNPVAGFTYYRHFHPGVDFAAAEGTPIYAPEAGVVTKAGWSSPASGIAVNVDIRPLTSTGGCRYVFGHMQNVAVKVGQHIERSQLLGHVGHTGIASGPHAHHGIQMGSMLYDPMLFYPGGANQDDPRIKPAAWPTDPTTDLYLGHFVIIEGAYTLNMYSVGPNCGLTRKQVAFKGSSSAPVARGVCGSRVYWKTTSGGLAGLSYVCGLTVSGWHIARRFRRPDGRTYDVRISCTGT